jgi:hypothetical protein
MSVKHAEKSMLRNFLAYLEGTSIPKDITLKEWKDLTPTI